MPGEGQTCPSPDAIINVYTSVSRLSRCLGLVVDRVAVRANLEKALAAYSGYFSAIDRLAALALREGKRDAARKRFEAVLKARPGDTHALAGLANLEEQASAPKSEVAALFAKAVSAKPARAGTFGPGAARLPRDERLRKPSAGRCVRRGVGASPTARPAPLRWGSCCWLA
jgi:cellulose synthase operon protein C